MAEYIEREAVLKHLDECKGEPSELCYTYALYRSIEHIVRDIPAADVAEVKRGKWIMRGGKLYCSSCQQRACVTRDSEDFWYTAGTEFCPNCGADMRG